MPIALHTVVTIRRNSADLISIGGHALDCQSFADLYADTATCTMVQRGIHAQQQKVWAVMALVLRHIDRSFWNIDVRVESEIPMGCGLGSSAALCVACLRAFLEYAYGHGLLDRWSLHDMCHEARLLERIFHGNPSGIDTTASLVEKPIVFCSGAWQPAALDERVGFMVVNTNVTRTTREVDMERSAKTVRTDMWWFDSEAAALSADRGSRWCGGQGCGCSLRLGGL